MTNILKRENRSKTIVFGTPNSEQAQRIIEVTQGDFDIVEYEVLGIDHLRMLLKDYSSTYKNLIVTKYSATHNTLSRLYFNDRAFSIDQNGVIYSIKRCGFKKVDQSIKL